MTAIKYLLLTGSKTRDCIMECERCGRVEITSAPLARQVYKIKIRDCLKCRPEGSFKQITGLCQYYTATGDHIRENGDVKRLDGSFLRSYTPGVFGGRIPADILRNAVNPEAVR